MSETGPVPSSAPARPRASSVPWGVVGMLVLVALGEWGFSRVEIDVIAPWHWDWRHAGRAATGPAAKADLLCFGDSLMKFGLLPKVVEHATGRPTYNLSVALGQTPSSYFLLRRALRAGAKPSAVLIDAAPVMLSENPCEPRHLRQWPELLNTAELLDLAWSLRDPNFFTATALAELLPSLRARDEVRTALTDASKGLPSTRRPFAESFRRNTRVNRGANAMTASTLQGDLTANCRMLFGRFACDPLNAAYLDRFFRLAAEHQIPVYWVITPATAEVEQMCQVSGFDAAWTAFVKAMQERHPNVTVLDGRRSGYGRDLYCIDSIHLNHIGGSALSAEIASILGRGAGSRWVTLPPYRPAQAGIVLEDVDASALALRNGGKAVR